MKHRAACVHSFCQKGAPHRSYLSAAVKCRADNKSSFADTSLSSRVSKGLVSGLTALVNNVAGNQPASQVPDLVQRPAKLARSPEEILDGVRRDFTEKNYLWTGRITVDLYDKSCSFTDPTISFTGVDTHQRNLAALSWLVDRLVSESSSELLSCDLNADSSAVVAQWRMQGSFSLPWHPVLDVAGKTVFTMSSDDEHRIVSYDEEWSIPAAEALKQLITPTKPPSQQS